MFTCHTCNKEIVIRPNDISTGYGLDSNGNKICYSCCAEADKQYMRDNGQIDLYLTINEYGRGKVTNWPGSLRFPNVCVSKGKHNLARIRYDVWFIFEGITWHGVQYGDNTQIVHCKRTKGK